MALGYRFFTSRTRSDAGLARQPPVAPRRIVGEFFMGVYRWRGWNRSIFFALH
jgi:hypothetical protein